MSDASTPPPPGTPAATAAQAAESAGERRWALGVLAAIWALLYGRYAAGFAPAGGDLINAYLPMQALVQQAVRAGELPLWNALTFGGRPLLADIQLGFFYPPNWLHWLLPLPLSFAWLLALHGALMFAGSWRLARAFGLRAAPAALGTVLFCASPFFTFKLSSGIVLFIHGCAWWPWIALATLRLAQRPGFARMAALAALLALALLAGAPQMAFYAWGTALLLGLVLPGGAAGEKAAGMRAWLARVGWLGAAYVAALGLTAIQTLPARAMIALSFARSGKAAWDYITNDSFAPKLFLLLLNPGIFGPGEDEGLYFGGSMGFNESAFYLPLWVAALLLPLGGLAAWRGMWGIGYGERGAARRRVLLLAMGAVGFGALLAMGRFSTLFALFYEYVPGFAQFRVPARMMLLPVAGVAVLAALALDALLRAREAADSAPHADGQAPRMPGPELTATVIGVGLAAGLTAVWGLFALRAGLWESVGNPLVRSGAILNAEVYAAQSGAALRQGLRVSIWMVLAAGLLLLLTRPRGTGVAGDARSLPGRLALFLPGLAGVELALLAAPFAPSMFFTRYAAEQYPRTAMIETLQAEDRGGRVLWLDDVIAWLHDQNHREAYPNRLVLHGIADARGYDPVNARWYGAWCNLLAGLEIDANPQGFMFVPQVARPAWLTLMGVDRVLSYQDLTALPGLEQYAAIDYPAGADHPAGRLRFYRNTLFRGMAWAARPEAFARDAGQALALSAQRADAAPGDPLAAIVGDGTPLPGGPVDARYEVEPLADEGNATPHRWAYRVSFPQPAMLCLAQSAYPGWGVRINGAWSELQSLSGTFLMAPVPAGEHEVIFDYSTPGLANGTTLTLATLVILGYGLARARLAARRGRPE